MLRELADGSRALAGKLAVQIMGMEKGPDRTILRKIQNRMLALAKECESWITRGSAPDHEQLHK